MTFVPYASNQGVRIRYEVEGKGPPLLMVHGLFQSLDEWYESGYVDSLKKDHQLVLMDMRGHGGSDKPHSPRLYRLELLAADPVAVLDTLNIKKAHYLGYSMGSRLGFGVAKYNSNRFISFILGGADPFNVGQAFTDSFVQTLRKGMNAMITYLREEWKMKIPPQLGAKWATNDTDALASFLKGSQWCSGVEEVLKRMAVPCLVYFGEGDDKDFGAKKWAGTMPDATLVYILGQDHIETFLRSDLVLPHITKFLKKVSQT